MRISKTLRLSERSILRVTVTEPVTSGAPAGDGAPSNAGPVLRQKNSVISTVTAISCTGPTIMVAATASTRASCVWCATPIAPPRRSTEWRPDPAPQGGRADHRRGSDHQGAFSSPWSPSYWEPRCGNASVAVGSGDRRHHQQPGPGERAYHAGTLPPLPTNRLVRSRRPATRPSDTSKPQPPDYGKVQPAAVRHIGQASGTGAVPPQPTNPAARRLGQPRTRVVLPAAVRSFAIVSRVRRRPLGLARGGVLGGAGSNGRQRATSQHRRQQRSRRSASRHPGVVAKLDLTLPHGSRVERHRPCSTD